MIHYDMQIEVLPIAYLKVQSQIGYLKRMRRSEKLSPI